MRAKVLVWAVAAGLLGGCGSDDSSDSAFYGANTYTPPAEGASTPDSSRSSQGGGSAQAGVLTAGVWDDNRNFAFFSSYRESLYGNNMTGLLPLAQSDHQAAFERFSVQPEARVTLDVALVLDTTGSMGDELAYLQKEFLAISGALHTRHPDAQQRWSLVVYRDQGDAYVTRSFDFTEHMEDFKATLAQQGADGGGDIPEAPEEGLEAANKLAWRSEDTTAKLLFWVADAPHHQGREGAMLSAIMGAQERGVHVYPVASSGVDELTEFTMRSAAQLTGGRYLFLTDDSGVGGEHKEPSIPCYFVTHLDQALLRVVDIELSGVYHEPTEDEVIRTGGNLKSGACRLSSGEDVEAF